MMLDTLLIFFAYLLLENSEDCEKQNGPINIKVKKSINRVLIFEKSIWNNFNFRENMICDLDIC